MKITYVPTWRTKLGLVLIAAGAAWANGEVHGAMGMLGAWLIWESLSGQ